MAKTGITNVTTNNTFQVWLDRTNDLLDLMATDVITASATGDNTGTVSNPKTANLLGTFTATNLTASNRLRSDTISATLGNNEVTVESILKVDTSNRVGFELQSTTNPIVRLNNTATSWDVGFASGSTNFTINTGGQAVERLKLSTSGNLTIPGVMTASAFVGSFTGGVNGQVNDISNFTTSDLAEGSNLYFTDARARAAIGVSGDLTYNSSTGIINLPKALTGTYTITSNSGVPLTIADAGGSTNNKMMVFDGSGTANLDILNHDDPGDYELRVTGSSHASSIRINDAQVGIQFFHTDTPASIGTSISPIMSIGSPGGQEKVEISSRLEVSNVITGTDITASGELSANTITGGVIATKTEAEEGTSNDTVMTPLRTQQAIDQLAAGEGSVLNSTAVKPFIRYQTSVNIGTTTNIISRPGVDYGDPRIVPGINDFSDVDAADFGDNVTEKNSTAKKIEFSSGNPFFVLGQRALEFDIRISQDPSDTTTPDFILVDFSENGTDYGDYVLLTDVTQDQQQIFMTVDVENKEIRWGGYNIEEAVGETPMDRPFAPSPVTVTGAYLNENTRYARILVVGKSGGGALGTGRATTFRGFAKMSRWGGAI